MIVPALRALRPTDVAPGRPCISSRSLQRHAGPDWLLAAGCLLLLWPPLSGSAHASGLAAVVRVHVLLCLLDLPVLYVVARFQHAPRWSAATAILLAHGSICAAMLWLAWGREASRPDVIALLVLPLLLRAWSLLQGLADMQRSALWLGFSLVLVAPWLLCFVAVLLPVAALLDLEQPVPGTSLVQFHPAAWLAMGSVYFAIAGAGRYVLARVAGAPRGAQ